MKSKTDKMQKSIGELRAGIDAIDAEIVELLSRRAGYAVEVGKAKDVESKEIYAPDREMQIYKRLSELNKGPLPEQAIWNVFREIISASRSLEKSIRIAFLGPQATFTHQACMEHFGLSAEFVAKNDISDVFGEVECGRADYGVVPIENTTEGVVSSTLDMFVTSDLKICAEKFLPISLSLLNKSGKAEDIKKICSRSIALAQCKDWLKEHFADAAVVNVSSTALAAREASEDESIGAVASRAAATLYGLKSVADSIEDNANNFTRFLVIGKNAAKKSGIDKTSLIFDVKDAPGALFNILKPFATRGINLTKIESRPVKKKAWAYIFFLDMDGHISDSDISDAIEELKEACSFVKIIGSYPKSPEISGSNE